VEKYGTINQATDDNTLQCRKDAICMRDNKDKNTESKGKGKIHPRTGHDGPYEEQKCVVKGPGRSTLGKYPAPIV
jgi:hypothetical protein